MRVERRQGGVTFSGNPITTTTRSLGLSHRDGIRRLTRTIDVLIGGFAANVHGSPMLTTDIDITPQEEPENLARLSAALTGLDARIRAEGVEPLPFSHDAESLAARRIWKLTTRFGDLDISMTPPGARGYDDLRRDAVEVTLQGVPVLLASLGRHRPQQGRCRAGQGPAGAAGPSRAARQGDPEAGGGG